ncbi:hypothetical protein SAMD00019534_005040 [Acytostelium subglobosum LB1]|uniref:hypothetical protein n=1 Tax=Acytostelium subglobosum LB1 TaxID=1410327 RepID=UPI000644FBB6|nr:hypothetical protein SAMD00019534_005040 [Acytostelium subglobosum LB1]GAM17329.1 hypothetical protein SAMD00019534_005040 [Acytostelium subglobosum LB1]|eukprot:XP_012759391.1 hypothetical protein SAMD00019534_005040 [Acytostelium subglobosum LB1]
MNKRKTTEDSTTTTSTTTTINTTTPEDLVVDSHKPSVPSITFVVDSKVKPTYNNVTSFDYASVVGQDVDLSNTTTTSTTTTTTATATETESKKKQRKNEESSSKNDGVHLVNDDDLLEFDTDTSYPYLDSFQYYSPPATTKTLSDDCVKLLKSSIEHDSPSTSYIGTNSFVLAAYQAYSNHMHLMIRPDDIWLALMTQFSFYVDRRSEELRSKFVAFDDKRTLVVRLPGSLYTAPYEQMSTLFVDQIALNIKDASLRDWVVPGFTTTTDTDRVVGACTLMSTMKKYFNFECELECGLPKVTMLGTVDDWRQVRQRAERFAEFDTKRKYMAKWLEMLLPVLDNMIMSVEGNPDIKWWNKIVHYADGGSGTSFLSGWITTFISFQSDGKWLGDNKSYYDDEDDECIKVKTEWPAIDIDNIPRGFSTCPVKIIDPEHQYDSDIYAGHIISKFTDDNTTITPSLDWFLILKGLSPQQ